MSDPERRAMPGRCHCGNLSLVFTTSRPLAELPVRTCSCSFCARHRPRYTSDAQGAVDIQVADPELLGRYRFGLELGDFLICRRCGVYVAALDDGDGEIRRAVVNIHCLDDASGFTGEPVAMCFDGEDPATRAARRARTWTPARLRLPGEDRP